MITVFAIGKKHEAWVQDGIARYENRLKAPFDIKWELLPHSSLENTAARREESQRLLQRLPPNAYIVLLDELGTQYTSEEFLSVLQSQLSYSKPLCVVIGGAYGVDEMLKARADTIMSLSKMVFPHQLVRLILIEQIYRAQAISQNQKYHHA